MKYITRVTSAAGQGDEAEFVIEIKDETTVIVNDQTLNIDVENLPRDGIVSLLLNNRSLEGLVSPRDGMQREVLVNGDLYTVTVQDERAYRLSQARGEASSTSGEATVKSPMPGVIVAVPIAEGDSVAKKQAVIILESMKMENELKAPRDGIILRVLVEPGQAVEKGEPLAIIGDAA